MGAGRRGFRRFGQAVTVAAAAVLLSAAGVPGGRGWHAARPAGAPAVVPGAASASATGQVKIFPGISIPGGITAGPDGALWFTNLFGGSVGRITTGGKISIFRERGQPEDIVTGPDHNLWVSNISGASGAFDSIARLTTSGRATYFTVPNKDEAWDITNGPGGLWFSVIQGEAGGGGAIDLITAR